MDSVETTSSAQPSSSGSRRLGVRESLVIAVTLFSMFFGAGNLILPPLLGLQAGTSAAGALVGFLVAAIGLPILGIVAVAGAGDIRRLASRVHPRFAFAFVVLVYLAIGPCLAIPRTSSTSFEMLVPLLGDAVPVGPARLAFSVAFFALAFAMALRPGRISKFLGRVTGPALILLIVLVVGSALLAPGGVAQQPVAPYDAVAPVQGFINGYQTMDLLASLTFGLVIAANVRQLGVSDEGGVAREVSKAGLVAGVLMGVIYVGLGYVGIVMGSQMPGATNGAAILTASATAHFGLAGTVFVAVIFLLACLNVCTGLISCCGSYFAETFPRLPYRVWAAAFAVFSCVVSNFGLDTILAFSVPLLGALYPPAIALVLMGMARRALDRVPLVWPCAVGLVCVESVAVALRDAFAPSMWMPLDALPLAGLGMGWVVPALVGLAVGAVASRALAGRRAA